MGSTRIGSTRMGCGPFNPRKGRCGRLSFAALWGRGRVGSCRDARPLGRLIENARLQVAFGSVDKITNRERASSN